MTLTFVAKGMKVEAPIAHINLNPLPHLPSGLTHAFLFRHSLTVSGTNLVTGEPTGMLEVRGGSFTYNDNSAFADPRKAGWEVPGWTYEKGSPVTFMAIGTSADSGNQGNTLMSAGRPQTGATFDLVLQSGGAYAYVRHSSVPGGVNVRMQWADDPPSTTPVMLFGSIDPTNTVTVFEPSAQTVESGVLAELDELESTGQVEIAVTTAQPDDPKDYDTYMAAGWNRVLSQGEMTAAYDALKPWLASRGVIIA